MSVIFMALASLTTYGRSVGDQFDVDGIKYEIASTTPAQVDIVGYDANSGTEVTIPRTVSYQGTDYQVTFIANNAFKEKQLTEVAFTPPSNVTRIWGEAFSGNRLTHLTIPESVTHIGHGTFWNNPLFQVTVEALDPPVIGQYSFQGRGNINLVVPPNKVQAYKDADYWKDFGFITSHAFTVDGITYGIVPTSPTEVRVMGYTGTATAVTIPQTVSDQGNDYQVTVIGKRAFRQKGLTEVTFTPPSNVTSIEEGAFDINQLTSIVIPESITKIEKWVFAQNKLEELFIPATVESIGYQAFYINGNLTQVRAERNPPTTVDPTAFQSSGNGNINLLVGSFGAIQAYRDAGWTKDIGINTVTMGTTVVDGVRYGITTAQPEATLMDVVSEIPSTLTIPPTVDIDGSPYPVTAIADNAIRTRNLVDVIIPSTSKIKSIGFQAFYNVPDLKRVRVELDDPPTLDADAFEYPYRTEIIDLIVPEGKEQVYMDAGWTGFKSISSFIGREHFAHHFLWEITSISPNKVKLLRYSGPAGEVEIPSEVTYHSFLEDNMYLVTAVGDSAFNNDFFLGRELTKVIIPDGVRSIGNSAFAQNQLTEVDIPDGVTSIGQDAFWQNRLTGVEIPESVTSLGQRAFGHNDFTEVAIPNGITRIEKWTFAQTGLEEVTLPGNVEYIGEQAFFENDLERVTIPGNVRTIDLYAFQGNPDLRLVTVEADDPPSLHELAFSNADRGQIDLVVPMGRKQEYLDNGWHGFRSISYGIFTVDNIIYGITSRTEVMVVGYTGTDTAVTIPETADDGEYAYTVAAIGKGALQNKGLTDVGIPSSVTSIGEGAFSDNQLTAVTLPGGVERIDGFAFHNNPGLALVTVEANDPPVLDATAFANANRHQIDLVVPTGKRQAYEDNGWGGFRSISEKIEVSIDSPAETINLSSFTVTIRFDMDVTGFTVDDIDLVNATADHFTGSGSTYTVEIAPTSCNGTVRIDVPANATDMANLAATATVTVVEDPDLLVAAARDITVQLDTNGQVTILPGDVDNGSAYGCGNAPELSLDMDTFDCGNVGTPVTVTLTATQGTESATATALVTVEENPDLVANAKDITVQLDASGQATILPGDVDNGSAYGCGGTPELGLDIDTFYCSDVGTTVTVTLTATSGDQTDISTAVVTVESTVNSLVAVAKDITVQLDADGTATIGPGQIDNGSGSGCNNISTISLSLDRDVFTCDDVGMATVVLTATQGSETATATATVTVEASGNCTPEPEPRPLVDFKRGFSPNGDGIGDTLVIEGLEQYGNNVLMIYDLSQRLLFSSHYGGPGDGWDGTDKRGLVPVGSYVCVIDYNEPGLGHEARMIYVNY